MLEIYGIDRLANELHNNHKYLVKEHLNIPIATQQILSYNDFVRSYNNAKTAAPIDTEFKFRTEEIKDILSYLDNNQTVLLCGDAGVGKTRLALECCKWYLEHNNYRLFCIRNNNQPIYEDLHLFFRESDNYIILIDDANELSEIETVIRYFIEKTDSDFKIIITVRNYAAEVVNTKLKTLLKLKVKKLTALKSNEIEELLKNEFGIVNPNYLNQIVKIAEGNARIAFLAGKVSVDANSFESIKNATDIYSVYYDKFLSDINLTEKRMYLAAAILAFLGAMHLDRLERNSNVLAACSMSIEQFKESIYQLHNYEIVDIYKDKAVKISDQCLANYILYYVFIKNKWMKLSEMIRYTFKLNKVQTVMSVNVLSNIFITEHNQDYLVSQIKELWDNLSIEDPIFFWEYVKVFYRANPSDALLLIRDKIDSIAEVVLKSDDLSLDERYNVVNDDILLILGGFANTEYLEAAIDLYFLYLEKRLDLFNQFYYTAVNNFGIDSDCYNNNFYTPIKFIENIIIKTNERKNKVFIKLLVNIAKYYLDTHFNGTEFKRGNSFMFYDFDLKSCTAVVEYREKIWNCLIDLFSENIETNFIEDLLYDLRYSLNEDGIDIFNIDYQYILKILDLCSDKHSYYFCIIIEKFAQLCDHANIDFNEYTNSDAFVIYKIFNRDADYSDLQWYEKNKCIRKKIMEFVSNCSKEEFFNILKFLLDTKGKEHCYVTNVFDYALEGILKNSSYYIDALQHLCSTQVKQVIDPYYQIDLMFKKYPDKEIWSIVSSLPDCCKNTWQYYYFVLLPVQFADAEHLHSWYGFLDDDSDKYIISSNRMDLFFLKKFYSIDKEVIVKSYEKIMKKHNSSELIVKCYLAPLFNPYIDRVDEVIEIFNGKYELLCQLYLMNLSLKNNEDYNGVCLKKIYEKYPLILDLIFQQYYMRLSSFSCEDIIRLNRLFELDNYFDIFDFIMNKFLELQNENYYPFYDVIPSLLSNGRLDEKHKNRPDEWIKRYIFKYAKDRGRMVLLFNGISSFHNEKKKEYLQLFVLNNKKFELFKELQLFPWITSYSGSEVPIIQNKIDFLSSLLPVLRGIDFLEHASYIGKEILKYKKFMEETEINEIINGL